MKKIRITIFVLVAIALFVSCSQEPKYKIKQLPSGKRIKIESVAKLFDGKGKSALMLTYYTDLEIDDKQSLQSEVEDIWRAFRIDVEKAGVQSALICASEMPHGFISRTSAFTFAYDQNASGDWVLSNPQK